MEVDKKIKIENIIIKLDENEAFYLKNLLLFAFDYECEHPNSLYRSEKELAKELIDKLSLDSQSAKAEEINHKSFQEMINEEEKRK